VFELKGLVLIGMGLWDERDVSLRGLAELKACDSAYAEAYTSDRSDGSLSRLAALCGKEITPLSREQVEDGRELLAEAAKRRVALLVGGDPMVSTTHVSLRIEAAKRGVAFSVVHAASIFSAAVSESGLHAYKFGRCVTLPYWSERYRPMTTYDVLMENGRLGLHTLLFLDLRGGKTMTPQEAFPLLAEMERERRQGVFTPDTEVAVLSRIGSDDARVSFGKAKELEGRSLGDTPFILIIPGRLHFTEREALEAFRA
jgi:diphthine synthase